MIRRQFHHKDRCFALQHGMLEKDTCQDGQHHPCHVDKENQCAAHLGKEDGRKENVNRQSRPAGHEWVEHDRQDAVALVVEGAGGHDGGDVAAKADEKREKGFAGQADDAEKAIHQESGAGHVSRVFEDGEAEKDDGDGRDKRGDNLYATTHAIGQECGEEFGRSYFFEQVSHGINKYGATEVIEEIDEGATDVVGQDKDAIHHQKKDGQAHETVQGYAVDAVGDGLANLIVVADHVACQAMDKAVASVGDHDVHLFARVFFDVFNLGLHRLGQLVARHLCAERILFEQFYGKPTRTDVVFFGKWQAEWTYLLDGLFQLLVVLDIDFGYAFFLCHLGNGVFQFFQTRFARSDQFDDGAPKVQCEVV